MRHPPLPVRAGFIRSHSIEPLEARIAPANVIFSDSTFLNADWTTSALNIPANGGAGNGSVTATQTTVGGNPGSFRDIVQSMADNGNLLGLHFLSTAAYNPAAQGAITSIDFSDDIRGIANTQNIGLVIAQNGNFYLGAPDTSPSGVWAARGGIGLLPGDFTEVGGGGVPLDFSGTAAPLIFGFYTSNTNAAGLTSEAGVDNYKVIVHNASVVVPLFEPARGNPAFVVSGGAVGNQTIDHVAVDLAGNTYVTGRFTGTVDFDPGPEIVTRTTAVGANRGFVAKYTGTGGLAWVDVVIPSNEPASAIRLAVSGGGEVFISAEFGAGGPLTIGTVDGDTSLIPAGPATSVFLANIHTTGRLGDAQVFGSSNTAARVSDLGVDAGGNVYLAGSVRAGAGAGGSLLLASSAINVDALETAAFVAKFQNTPAFGVVWANQITSPGVGGNSFGPSIAVSDAGAVTVGGVFSGNVRFPSPTSPTLISADPSDIFVARLNNAGAWIFAGEIENSGAAAKVSVATDAAGNYYVASTFFGSPDFDPGVGVFPLTAVGARDAFVEKLDNLGAFVGVAQFGGVGPDEAGLLRMGRDNVLRLGMTFSGTVDFDPGSGILNRTATGAENVALVTLDANLGLLGTDTYLATRLAIGSGIDLNGGIGVDLALDSSGSVYFAGGFNKTLDLDPGLKIKKVTSNGGTDFFLVRYFPGDLVAQSLAAPLVTSPVVITAAGDQQGRAIVTNGDGTIWVAGTFNGTVDFDPGPGVTNLTSTDLDGNIFVAKFDSSGLVWARSVQMNLSFNANASDVGVLLAVDGNFNVYLSGEYEGTATFSPTASSPLTLTNSDPTPGLDHRDVFLTRLDANGVFQWAGSIGRSGANEFVEAITVNPNTNAVALAGTFTGTVDFDFALANNTNTTAIHVAGDGDGFIAEYQTSGAFDWVRQLGGNTSRAAVKAMTYDHNFDLVTSGEFDGTPDFNFPGSPDLLTGSGNSVNVFVAKFLGTNGQVVWHREFSGPGDESGRGIAVDSQNALIVTGGFTGSTDFDPGTGTHFLTEVGAGDGDVFLLKLDNGGLFLNATSFGSVRKDRGERVFVDVNDGIFLVGDASQDNGSVQDSPALPIDLDPGPGIAAVAVDQFVAHFTKDLKFVTGYALGPTIAVEARAAAGDSDGHVFITGNFRGKTTLAGKTFTAKSDDFFFAQLSPGTTADAAHPRTFHDSDGDLITIRITGPGTATYLLDNNAGDLADLAELDLTGTDINTTVSLTITQFGSGSGTTGIGKIRTFDTVPGVATDLGSLILPANSTFGDGLTDTDIDLEVTGRMKTLTLWDVNPQTIIQLGRELPYNFAADTTTSDTYNNKPNLTIHDVFGPGVQVNLVGDGVTSQGIGGGGLGTVLIHRWDSPGFIRTLQSVGNFTVQTGDFLAALEIDKLGLGENTKANVGTMNIETGSWGSTGTVIEGNVTAFDFDAFLAGAAITAGSVGKITVEGGSSDDGFAGTLTLTEAGAAGVGAFTVSSDFTGSVVTNSPLKKLNIRGAFTGSLSAPSIAGITAFSFPGTQTGGVNDHSITTTAGLLGKLKTLSGVFKNYELTTPGIFSGIDVNLSKLLTGTTVGIENVHITAASVGALNVSLTASSTALGVDLVGIRNSTFTAIGGVNAVNGAIVPAAVGKITVKLAGQDGLALGIDHVSFTGSTIAATNVSVGHRANLAVLPDVRGLDTVAFTATTTLGTITVAGDATGTQATALTAIAGGTVGAISIKSKNPDFGSLVNSTILAGQALDFTGATTASLVAAKLRGAALGAVTLSGSLTNSLIAAGSNIGALTVGNAVASTNLIAGALLGPDHTLDGVADSFQHAASIAAITVKKGGFILSTAAAGIDPVAGGFGDADDKIATNPVLIPAVANGTIGAIKLALGASIPGLPAGALTHVIEAARIKSLTLGTTPAITDFTTASLLDNDPLGEDVGDLLVRTFVTI